VIIGSVGSVRLYVTVDGARWEMVMVSVKSMTGGRSEEMKR
jgi:hypothetical protein